MEGVLRGYTYFTISQQVRDSVVHSNAQQEGGVKVKVLNELLVLFGKEGEHWNHYVSCEIYWRKWAELNRN